jgi:branched-subunit amino acid ABC-type transport system permease component
MFSLDLAVNAVVTGLLLGCFYAAVTIGVTISFGMLDIVNFAHAAFVMLVSLSFGSGFQDVIIDAKDGSLDTNVLGVGAGDEVLPTRSIVVQKADVPHN